MTVEEVYIRGKYPDLEHMVKIAIAEAKRLFNIKGKVMITDFQQVPKRKENKQVNIERQNHSGIGVPNRG